jgi:hypothetical protein
MAPQALEKLRKVIEEKEKLLKGLQSLRTDWEAICRLQNEIPELQVPRSP